MKRHSALIPVSHDHHHGLVLAQRLKRGYSKSPSSDWPDDLLEQRTRVLDFYRSQLAPHFRAEEDFLFPLAEQYLEDRQIVSELRQEHQDIESLIDSLRETQELSEAFAKLGEILERHIRKEESVLFEKMQESVPEAELQRAGIGIEEFYASVGKESGHTIF
ncbi:MAG TPA: hemerythrin domain-containing protein [Acidobacteriota bacterium]|nr:hemerythrin domain-containing protein [Acidobacteriota bacterium]